MCHPFHLHCFKFSCTCIKTLFLYLNYSFTCMIVTFLECVLLLLVVRIFKYCSTCTKKKPSIKKDLFPSWSVNTPIKGLENKRYENLYFCSFPGIVLLLHSPIAIQAKITCNLWYCTTWWWLGICLLSWGERY